MYEVLVSAQTYLASDDRVKHFAVAIQLLNEKQKYTLSEKSMFSAFILCRDLLLNDSKFASVKVPHSSLGYIQFIRFTHAISQS